MTSRPSTTTTAILSALQEEQQGLIDLLAKPQKTNHAGRDFWQGRLHGQPVVLALSRIGKVAAATTSVALIERFNAGRIVFTGVAGGLGDGVQVGDMVVASEGTRFGVNGVNIGLFCSTPMVALTRKVPPAVAFEMLSTGEFVSAARAREIGLLNRVTAPEELESDTRKLAETVAAKLSIATRLGKSAFYTQLGLTTAEAYAYAGRVMVENMLDADTDEGICAFLEKRKPNWGQD
eukprot:gene39785-48439_t